MAQRNIVVLEDDLGDGDADETVVFALDGTTYEIDLTEENAARLRDELANWVASARPRRGTRSVRSRATRTRSAAARSTDLGEIREWARANGHQVSDRGRISAAVQEAYEAAH